MTKELKTIDLNLLPIVTLGEMANEAAEQVEKNAKATVQKAIDCGRYLTAIKEQLEHGQWGGWLGANWNYSQKTAAQYMQISNFTSGLNLTDASSISEALRMISDNKPETVPRSERKPAEVKVRIPAESREFQDEPDIDVPFSPIDDDPTPDPPTNRKTAKGSEKVPEADKPRTQQVVPEILPEEPKEILPEEKTLSDFSLDEIFEFIKDVSEGDVKNIAKRLRKLADKLDPPTKFVRPDGNDVIGYLASYATDEKFIAEHGVRTEEQLETAADGFIDHYSSNGWMVGKVKMSDWRATARKWLKNQGQFSNGKANGNGHRTTEATNPGSCLGPNGRPRVERAKITYK